MTDERNAFVILPFNEQFEELYKDIIEPVLEEEGYEVNKADSMGSQRNIIEDVIKGIVNSDLLIADLTNLNPNVFYELGIAHGIGVPTVLITQDLDELPFDLSAYHTIEYSRVYNEIDELKEEISEIGENHMNGSVSFGNPVSDFTDIEIKQPPTEEEEETTDQVQDDVEENEASEPEMGLFDYVAEIDDRLTSLNDGMSNITDRTFELRSEILSKTSELETAVDQNGGAHKEANRIARRLATDLKSYSSDLDEELGQIDEDLDFIMSAQEKFIEVADPSDDEHEELLIDMRNEFKEFVDETNEASQGITEITDDLNTIRGMNRDLDQGINQVTSTLDELDNTLQKGIAKAQRHISLIEQKLNG
ncbi:nucleoside 2-deoxyribosyltransferase [Halorarius halobius]|uniref:nucleoside 2-deoxyribosyltransferase n=1 Tax=Halorarius halobius TaxID=2962671 RepID=UPI0020CC2999|nr:nucleoside 2-deoxyribosyltransferase [Halorarius halobius]